MLQKAFLKSLVLTVVAMLVFSGATMAQTKDPAQMDNSTAPNHTPLGGGDCSVGRAISDLRVTLQVTHSWVGDLDFTITHDDTGTSAVIFDQPGVPASTFGCSDNNLDMVLHDGGQAGLENHCAGTDPAFSGEWAPDPDALSVFAGEVLDGTWTLAAGDNAGGDSGTLDTWCLADGTGGTCCSNPGTPFTDLATITDTLDLGGGGETTGDVPATSTWGVIALMALFMGVSVYFLRRRGSASA